MLIEWIVIEKLGKYVNFTLEQTTSLRGGVEI